MFVGKTRITEFTFEIVLFAQHDTEMQDDKQYWQQYDDGRRIGDDPYANINQHKRDTADQ